MKALATDGGIEGLAVRDVPVPELRKGEVRVRVRASALNPADQKVLSGALIGNILHGKQRPLVTGWDVAGVVDAVGPGADFAIGDEVFGFLAYSRSTKRGAFAEQVAVPATALARRPAALSPGDACALATAGVTALQVLRDIAAVKPGQRVLVVGASGGVGTFAVGVGAKLGAHVTGICSASVADFVRSLGASAIVVRGQVDPLESTERYDVIVDAAVAYTFSTVKHLLDPGGIYVSTLPSPGLIASIPVAKLLGKRAAFVAVANKRADLELLASWVSEGLIVATDSTFPVRDVGKALERLAKGGMKGRVVITVEGGF